MTQNRDTPDTDNKPADTRTPPEGPHAKPAETDKSKTPGSGMFPEPGQKESEPPSG